MNLHTIENALISLEFGIQILRDATKAYLAMKKKGALEIPVVSGNVRITQYSPSMDCYVTIQQNDCDTGEDEEVTVFIPSQAKSERAYICHRAIVGRCGF